MEINGYRDWFLPSLDELDLMCRNLYQKGLGGFFDGFYWSSTQRNSDLAWNIFFPFYSHGPYEYKMDEINVRAVRAF
jgi:hypothetical protein